MRKRKPANDGLPTNLKFYGGYYSYTHPITGRHYGMGKHRGKAIADAKILNERLVPTNSRIDQILAGQKTSHPVDHYITQVELRWKDAVAQNKLAPSTLKKNMTYIPAIRSEFGSLMPAAIRTAQFESFLNLYKVNARQTLRSILNTIWSDVTRLEELEFNAVERTTVIKPEVQRQRLSYPLYVAIRKKVPVWVQHAMNLMWHTALRPNDLVRLKKSQVRTEDGKTFIYSRPSKTRRKTNKGLRMECGPPVLALLKDCRDDVLSEYVLHFPYRPGRFKRFTGKPLDTKYLAHQFQYARDEVYKEQPELFVCPDDKSDDHDAMRPMEREEFPTLYEVRSLASVMYEEAQKKAKDTGQKRKASNILGHADERTTEEHYFSRHPVRWTEVAIGHEE